MKREINPWITNSPKDYEHRLWGLADLVQVLDVFFTSKATSLSRLTSLSLCCTCKMEVSNP